MQIVFATFLSLMLITSSPKDYTSFTLRNNSAKSIPLNIPSVMNPNLSPFSNSGVSLKIGQEIFFYENKKKQLLLTVTSDLEGDTLIVNELIKQRKGQLKSFLLRLTASVEDAEDIMQDTYIKAAEKIESFRAESSLKTWIFTIAANLAKDNLRAKRRWTEDVTDQGKAAALTDKNFFAEAMQKSESS